MVFPTKSGMWARSLIGVPEDDDDEEEDDDDEDGDNRLKVLVLGLHALLTSMSMLRERSNS